MIQQPAVAGMFYPANPELLREQVSAYLASAKDLGLKDVKALVAPHAGYQYSGPIAGSAYAQLASQAKQIKRVVLLSPSHRVYFRGIATSSASAFRTPIGDVPVDQAAVTQALSLPQVIQEDRAFSGEHALEVHLPFLQTMLPDFKLAPFVLGDASPKQVAELLELLWGGDETLILISSDLSHYYDYATAQRLDAQTSQAIEHLAPEQIDEEGACGRIPLRGLLVAARHHGLSAMTLDLRNSGDTSGSKDRVVGYGAYLFH